MNNDNFQPNHLKTTILDLLKDDNKELAWKLIDHYYKKSTEIIHFDILGYVSLKAHKRDTYLKCAEAAYSLAKTPDQLYKARSNLYKAYNTMNYPEKALFYVEQNLKINPNDVEGLCNKAFNLSLMGNKEAAENLLINLIKKNPQDIEKFQAAFAGKHLREGRTAKGILAFLESYKPKNKLFETHLNMNRWKGEITPGRKLYVNIEGGLGDQIINIRFFDKLKSLGMHPILVSESSRYYTDINRTFRRHGYDIITDTVVIDRKESWAHMMSLPGYLNLTEDELWDGPYITPIRNPKNKLAGTKPKIGIKCSGNPYFDQDEYRKIPIESIMKILPTNSDIYYIDNEKEYDCTINLKSKIQSWEDTLDFIDQMDCIVSSCTSLVHAAGAMGKTTFVAVPIAEYYTWSSTRTDGSSPWYGDNFYVAKQKKVRNWEEPLSEIETRIKSFLGEKYK